MAGVAQRDLVYRVALVTGSTSGIGLGIARGLAAKGCDIIITGFADQKLIDELKDEFTKRFEVKSCYIAADLSKTEEVTKLCEEIKLIYPAGVDILINNAGFQHVSPVEDFALDKWDSMLAVMLTAPFLLIKNLLPLMRIKGWGRIINISSAHGIVASANKSAYVTAKHGVIGLTKVIALESAGQGITCNAICPGYVETPILEGQVKALAEKESLSYDDAKAKFLANFHASKAPVGINQLADYVCFLCTESASQMTGSSVVIDGGWTAR